MPKLIRDEGKLSAPICLIGEAPGRSEEAKGKPFIGASYHQRLKPWWAAVGLDRKQHFYITNVYPYRPQANKIETIPRDELTEWVGKLHERLAKLTQPKVIVPTGNIALRALLRRDLFRQDSPKITDWRGSIFEYEDLKGRKLKVVPTLHPAATFRIMAWITLCEIDWRRISGERHIEGLNHPDYDIQVAQNDAQARELLKSLEHESIRDQPLAIDIETKPSEGKILCVGLGGSERAVVVPWTRKTQKHLRRICESPREKILQTGLYDAYWMKRVGGITIRNFRWDTLCLHHVLDPEMPHDLATLGSIYTRQPFWKKDHKDGKETKAYYASWDKLLVYCGTDVCVTAQVWAGLLEELTPEQIEVYHQHYQALFDPLLRVMLRGVRVDQEKRKAQLLDLQERCLDIQDELARIAGKPLHGPKDLSQKELKWFLYECLDLPPVKKRGGGITSDELALRKLRLRWGEQEAPQGTTVGACLDLILEHREKAKTLTFLKRSATDQDDRLRCHYKLTPISGRLASAKNPMGTGMNLQNVHKAVRECFVPDGGG